MWLPCYVFLAVAFGRSVRLFFGFSAVHGGHPVTSAGEVLSRVAQLARALPAED